MESGKHRAPMVSRSAAAAAGEVNAVRIDISMHMEERQRTKTDKNYFTALHDSEMQDAALGPGKEVMGVMEEEESPKSKLPTMFRPGGKAENMLLQDMARNAARAAARKKAQAIKAQAVDDEEPEKSEVSDEERARRSSISTLTSFDSIAEAADNLIAAMLQAGSDSSSSSDTTSSDEAEQSTTPSQAKAATTPTPAPRSKLPQNAKTTAADPSPTSSPSQAESIIVASSSRKMNPRSNMTKPVSTPSNVKHAPVRARSAAAPGAKTPSRSSVETFRTNYVEQHAHTENFHHRGKGFWARGLPPPGSRPTMGCRGPGAVAWKVQASKEFREKKKRAFAGRAASPEIAESDQED